MQLTLRRSLNDRQYHSKNREIYQSSRSAFEDMSLLGKRWCRHNYLWLIVSFVTWSTPSPPLLSCQPRRVRWFTPPFILHDCKLGLTMLLYW